MKREMYFMLVLKMEKSKVRFRNVQSDVTIFFYFYPPSR
jgi:hypothetical protein